MFDECFRVYSSVQTVTSLSLSFYLSHAGAHTLRLFEYVYRFLLRCRGCIRSISQVTNSHSYVPFRVSVSCLATCMYASVLSRSPFLTLALSHAHAIPFLRALFHERALFCARSLSCALSYFLAVALSLTLSLTRSRALSLFLSAPGC